MNLLSLRKKFRQLSGRFDLINEDGSDNGMDFFINAGSRFLDRLDEVQKSWASYFTTLAVGRFIVTFPMSRAIKEVWVATADDGRWQLEKKDLQDLMAGYLTGLPSSRSSGSPLYYSPCITRHIPEDVTADGLDAFAGFIETPAGNAYEYNSILINVPTDKTLMVDIRGLFYSKELEENEDRNYWTETNPMLLYMSTMRQIEVVNRNTQGVNDWTSAISTEMSQLGMDLVEELIAEVDQMEG